MNNPIGTGFNYFRALFDSICEKEGIADLLDALGQLDLKNLETLSYAVLLGLQILTAADLLRSRSGKLLKSELARINLAAASGGFDFDCVKPLLSAVLDAKPDHEIWDRVYKAVDELTALPAPIASSFQDTPWLRNTSIFVNSSENRKYIDSVPNLVTASQAVFDKCTEGSNPSFSKGGWSGWLPGAKEDSVFHWLTNISEKLATLGEEYNQAGRRRGALGRPHKPIHGSTTRQKMEIGFVSSDEVTENGECHWSQILVFDRLGGIASDCFDVNKNGLRFTQLGFDPTVITSASKRYIEVNRNGCWERLIIDAVIRRAPGIAGRGTTCWKAHSDNDPDTPLVIKDSWQCTERGEEGELLQTATNRNVVNVGRYYYHYTVQVDGTDDDVQSNARGGLDITGAENYQLRQSVTPRADVATVASPTALLNRIHWRLIIRDYGQLIYKLSSCTALLSALVGSDILHRDISINNLIINEEESNHSWPSFLIDLDLAVRERREGASGTKAFLAIGALEGERHSFMHDLELDKVVPDLDRWHYMRMGILAALNRGCVSNEAYFIKESKRDFTPYYQPMVPWLNRLRKAVFPGGGTWEIENENLYSQMKDILREAQQDPEIAA
ncbi:serine/threonine-protein kinase Sgk2 [Nemania sp. FL0031]|nr:serine/threonine-protein kinase Sgk2 [Nemania sp. FL0031]